MANKSLGGLRANTMNATNSCLKVLRGSQVMMAFRILPLSTYSAEKAVRAGAHSTFPPPPALPTLHWPGIWHSHFLALVFHVFLHTTSTNPSPPLPFPRECVVKAPWGKQETMREEKGRGTPILGKSEITGLKLISMNDETDDEMTK